MVLGGGSLSCYYTNYTHANSFAVAVFAAMLIV